MNVQATAETYESYVERLPEGSAKIDIRNLSFHYGKNKALHGVSNATDQSREVLRMTQHLSARSLRIVRELVSKTGGFRSDTPQLEPTGIADFVELEVRSVAGIAAMSRPHLHR